MWNDKENNTPDLSARIGHHVKKEDIDESDAIRQVIKLGLKEYAVNLYKERKITLREASELADASPGEMLDLLMEHWIKGNVTTAAEIAGVC